VKRILKPAKEPWVSVSIHVREVTRQRMSAARKSAEKQGLDFNAMIDAAVTEVLDEVLRSTGRPTAVTNGSLPASSNGEA
jgi:hypothetical protein